MSDIRNYIKRSEAANADEAVRPHVAENLKARIKAAIKISTSLPPERHGPIYGAFIDNEVIFIAPDQPQLIPHPELNAIREGVRAIQDAHDKVHKSVSTLVIGATYREIHKYKSNPNVHFSLYDSEAKDDTRITAPMLASISDLLQAACKVMPKDFRNISVDLTSSEVVELFCEINDLVGRLHYRCEEDPNTKEKFERIIANDCHYNWTWPQIDRFMTNTGANVLTVMGLFPVELFGVRCPENDLYKMVSVGDRWRMTDIRGFANGYEHKKSTWSTLMLQMGYNGSTRSYVSEIKSRAGPFCVVEVSVTSKAGKVVRDITLFNQQYVSIVDLMQEHKPNNLGQFALGEVIDFEKRVLIPRSEWIQVLEYVQSLKEASLQSENIQSFIRRRRGGAALVDQIFVKSWESKPETHQAVIACALRVAMENRTLGASNAALLATENPFRTFARYCLSVVKLPSIFDWFLGAQEIFGDRLCHLVDPVFSQSYRIESRCASLKHRLNVRSRKHDPLVLDDRVCVACQEFPWLHEDDESDLQTMVCQKILEELPEHNYSLTQSELDAFRLKLKFDPNDAPGIAKVKAAALDKCPRNAFSIRVPYMIIDGAAGTGKSTQIRKKITNSDAVWAPFSALKKDYQGKDTEGNDINFATMHRIISDGQPKTNIFTDETLSLPYEFIAVGVYRAQPSMMYHFIGSNQTQTLPSEGTPFSTKFNTKNAHYLLKNFRNTKDTVEWMRTHQGIDVECAGPQFNSDEPFYRFVHENDANIKLEAGQYDYVITPDRASVDIEESDNTVRGFQGRTNEILLRITPGALSTFRIPCINYVALTRCRKTLDILLVNGTDEMVVRKIIETENRKMAMRKKHFKSENLGKALPTLYNALVDIEDREALEAIRLVSKPVVKKEPPVEVDPIEEEIAQAMSEELEEPDTPPTSEEEDDDEDDKTEVTATSATLTITPEVESHICQRCGKIGFFGNEFAWGPSTGKSRYCSEVCFGFLLPQESSVVQMASISGPVSIQEEDTIEMISAGGTVSITVPTVEVDCPELTPEDSISQVGAQDTQEPIMTPAEARAEGVQIVVDIVKNVEDLRTLERDAFVAGRQDIVDQVEEVLETRRKQLDEDVLHAACIADDLSDCRSETTVSDLGSDFDREMSELCDGECGECEDCVHDALLLDQMTNILLGT